MIFFNKKLLAVAVIAATTAFPAQAYTWKNHWESGFKRIDYFCTLLEPTNHATWRHVTYCELSSDDVRWLQITNTYSGATYTACFNGGPKGNYPSTQTSYKRYALQTGQEVKWATGYYQNTYHYTHKLSVFTAFDFLWNSTTSTTPWNRNAGSRKGGTKNCAMGGAM